VRTTEPPIRGRHLVVIHNVDSGVLRSAFGGWRRTRTSEDRSCALCALTRGIRGTNPRWQRYLDSLAEPVHVVTRDQWRADHASSSWRNIELPAILLQTGSKIESLVSAKEIRKSGSVKELSDRIDKALRAHPDDRSFSHGAER
jgi:hypothetical protein